MNEKELTDYIYHSNHIEGYRPQNYGPGTAIFDNHLKAAGEALLGNWHPLELHSILMYGLLPPWETGAYRDRDVYIGGRPAIHPASIPYRMQEWEQMVHHGREAGEWNEEWAWRMHDHFECIHPFIDGNGRTGRLILNALRMQAGLRWLTIHVGDEQEAYYQHIQEYRDHVFEG